MLDLDRFKAVNDSLGHHVGDELLVHVASRLQAVADAEPSWSVARLGGDEFVVLLEGITGPEPAEQVARSLLDLLAEPIQLRNGQQMSTTVSIGISLATDPSVTREILLREADLALYAAKDAGRNSYALCDATLRDAVRMRVETEDRLRSALEEGRLQVHLQPVVDLADRSVVSFEALVRLVRARRDARAAGRLHPGRGGHRACRGGRPLRSQGVRPAAEQPRRPECRPVPARLGEPLGPNPAAAGPRRDRRRRPGRARGAPARGSRWRSPSGACWRTTRRCWPRCAGFATSGPPWPSTTSEPATRRSRTSGRSSCSS